MDRAILSPRILPSGTIDRRDRQLPTWAFEDYEDWPDFRAGAFFGLEMAGLTEELDAVSLAEFAMCRWTTSTPPSLEALDGFARCCERRADIRQ